MNWSAIAIVQVKFSKKTLSDDHIQAIESLLRKYQNVDNLNIHNKKLISFYIWGKNRVVYGPLDELKNKLAGLGFENFEISAQEYLESGHDYYYPAR